MSLEPCEADSPAAGAQRSVINKVPRILALCCMNINGASRTRYTLAGFHEVCWGKTQTQLLLLQISSGIRARISRNYAELFSQSFRNYGVKAHEGGGHAGTGARRQPPLHRQLPSAVLEAALEELV